ncbi:serine/threonine-protein kinase Sgk2 [Daldinia grandis]|nr:serine/threonine-protein kinase Sgk2 [Daldinia grandis]
MSLTEEQIKIISELPLNETLDPFRDKLRNFNEDHESRRAHITELLGALVLCPAALNLSSPDRSGSAAVKLLALRQHIRGIEVQLDQFDTLVRYIVDKSSDLAIWAAVFNLIDTIHPRTPPASSIPPTFKGTPVKASSNRLADSETRNVVEAELFEEIKHCVFRDIGGFWDKFFNSENWREEQKAMLNGLLTAHDGKKWENFPHITDEKFVWDWLRSLEERFLADAPYKLHTTTTANQFKERRGQMDLFLQKPPKEASTFWYKHVLVVGEQKKSYATGRFKQDLLQLTRYVRGIFADQPTRRFVHAFTFCASKMELWIFDRSGAYSSGVFDIHDEPDKFAHAFVGYTSMDDNAMGLDMFIEREDNRRYVTLRNVSNDKDTRIRLDKPMVRQKAIVCRGTTCYETENNHVAKFSWASDKRKLEVEHLELAAERGVQGVAKVVAYRRITTIAKMRAGLQFPPAHPFRAAGDLLESPSSAAANTTIAPNHKRKSSSAGVTADDNNGSRFKRSRSNSYKSRLGRKAEEDPSVIADKGRRPSLYTTGDEDLWDDRIFSCLVVSPAGRVISEFNTVRELLESMRDAIRAHQSLYTIGNILHRDISSNNIIITKPTDTTDGFKGMLIDLDLAKVRDSGSSGARHQTGTMQFMAVEVLRKTDHTYRHDLESFFYVLLWMCARQSWSNAFSRYDEQAPKKSLFRRWEIGSFEEIADSKEGHMTVNGLERIIGEFPQSLDIVKPLCLKIRAFLFGDTARLILGTPAGDPEQLYGPIIAAYDETISSL